VRPAHQTGHRCGFFLPLAIMLGLTGGLFYPPRGAKPDPAKQSAILLQVRSRKFSKAQPQRVVLSFRVLFDSTTPRQLLQTSF